ncbi:hypothetical protein ACQ4PT_018268 [Festuca glaucescens]
MEVKDLGENVFLFTFHQASGRKKAVENGPWMFDKDLLVLEEYDASKSTDEYAFDTIPIWVRIFKLPLGSMNEDTGEQIGNQIGQFLEVEGLVDGLAVGKYLRVKVGVLKQKRYRKIERTGEINGKGGKLSTTKLGLKRGGDEMEVEDQTKQKKMREVDVVMEDGDNYNKSNSTDVGLSEQLRKSQ